MNRAPTIRIHSNLPPNQGHIPSAVRLIWCWIWIALCLWLGCDSRPLHADEYADAFAQANTLYAQGQYPEAIAIYQKLVKSSRASAAVYFNLGNAYFKNNQLGYAIAYYRLAGNWAPRDPDVRANLQYARLRVSATGSPDPPKISLIGLSWLTLNEWTVLASVLGWAWFSLLIWGQWRADWKSRLRKPTRVCGVIWVLLMLCLGLRMYSHFANKAAVVVAKDVQVRYGPLEEARPAFTLPEGSEVAVLDQQDHWLQIRDGSRRTGWLRRDQAMFGLL